MGDVLAGAGLLVAVIAAAASMVTEPSRRRSAAMLIALALIPVLILGDQWRSAEITDLRHHADRFAALAVAGVIVVAAFTALFRRRPWLLPVAVIAAIPFRIPIHAGGQEANLLIPLYLVIGGGVLMTVWSEWEEHRAESSAGGAEDAIASRAQGSSTVASASSVTGPAGATSGPAGAASGPAARRMNLLPIALAAVLVLYALQSVYSEDFSRALQNSAFFYLPFALAFTLLAGYVWERKLIVWCLGVVAAEALVFVLFGFWEYGARHLIWNPEVIQSNDFHTYFRVNSLFWDPNVYGRYLALTITAIAAALLWARSQRLVLWLGLLVAVLWLGLITTFSQSSFVALLVGLMALSALRWSARWTIAVGGGAAILAIAFVLAAGGSLKINLSTEHTLNKDTSGRANLVSEGIALFGNRPLWGYGSGSFSVAYQKHRTGGSGQLTVSHTEPVTVAAEQGLIGLIAYLALLGVAFATLARGFLALMPGLRSPPSAGGASDAVPSARSVSSTVGSASGATGPAAGVASSVTGPATAAFASMAARAAIFACFLALIAHTMAYAGFLEDPLTWVLLSIGGSLAVAPRPAAERTDAEPGPATPTSPPAQATA